MIKDHIEEEGRNILGFDRLNRPVYPGDLVVDALGRRYEVRADGYAYDQNSPAFASLSDLNGPTLEAPLQPQRPAPSAEQLALHAYDDPKIGPKVPRKAPIKREPKQEKQEKKVGTPRPFAGRKNHSGLVRVGNITKAVGYNLGNGTAVLREAGIEIVKDPATGTPCVRLQDKDAARELLASLVPPVGAVAIDASADVKEKERIPCDLVREIKTGRKFLAEYSREAAEWYEKGTGKAYSHDEIDVLEFDVRLPEGPAVDFDALKEQPALAQPEPATGLEVGENFALADYTDDELREEIRRRGLLPALRITDPAREFTKADALLILEDEDHVKALRDAGWTVTCTKSI